MCLLVSPRRVVGVREDVIHTTPAVFDSSLGFRTLGRKQPALDALGSGHLLAKEIV